MKDFYAKFEEGCFYHVFNRGNSGKIFFSEENYRYFLRKLAFYLSEVLEVHAYCLLPNHFHLLIQVKSGKAKEAPAAVSNQFRRVFICYTQAINKQQNRTGSLFQKKFKRIQIKNLRHLKYLVYYIHANPSNHIIIQDFANYPHSSYKRILNPAPTLLMKNSVLDLFEGRENYVNFHNEMHDLRQLSHLILE